VKGFWVLDILCLAGILGSAALVVALRNLSAAVVALSGVGTSLALLFVVLGAPDVAHAEIAVGSIALPVLYLIAVAKVRADVPDRGDLGEMTHADQEPPTTGRPGEGPSAVRQTGAR
jgi:uncharacterized MnhB-related membrane protein